MTSEMAKAARMPPYSWLGTGNTAARIENKREQLTQLVNIVVLPQVREFIPAADETTAVWLEGSLVYGYTGGLNTFHVIAPTSATAVDVTPPIHCVYLNFYGARPRDFFGTRLDLYDPTDPLSAGTAQFACEMEGVLVRGKSPFTEPLPDDPILLAQCANALSLKGILQRLDTLQSSTTMKKPWKHWWTPDFMSDVVRVLGTSRIVNQEPYLGNPEVLLITLVENNTLTLAEAQTVRELMNVTPQTASALTRTDFDFLYALRPKLVAQGELMHFTDF